MEKRPHETEAGLHRVLPRFESRSRHLFPKHDKASWTPEKGFVVIAKAGLGLKISKHSFVMPAVKLFGHLVTARGNEADPEEINTIRDACVPIYYYATSELHQIDSL